MVRRVFFLAMTALAFNLAVAATAQEKKSKSESKSEQTLVIELVQTPGQFEPQRLTMKPGKYVFKVTNKSVDHEVGFYLRAKTADGKDGAPLPNSNPGHMKKKEPPLRRPQAGHLV